MKKQTLLIALLTSFLFFLAGCDEGPAENAGEKIDDVADDIADGLEDAGNEIEDACEEAKQNMGAKNTNC